MVRWRGRVTTMISRIKSSVNGKWNKSVSKRIGSWKNCAIFITVDIVWFFVFFFY